MHFAPVIAAACVLLGTASAAGVYVPIHKRYSYNALVNDFSYLGMLSKRDACSDAFGSNAHNSICAPDFTLCCTRDRQSYPSCEKWIGKGWCCVGEGDNDMCYVDQASVCNQEGSVECTRLKTGAKKACCPKLTTCDTNTDAYEQAVRCNIARGDLIEAAKSAEAKTASTSPTSTASSSSSIDAPTSTSASAAQTTAPESQAATPTGSGDDDSATISGGAIGGIVVGAVAGVGLIAGLVWFFMRRNKKAKYEAASQNPQPSIPQYFEDQQLKYQQQQQGYWPQGSPNQGGYAYSSPQPPSELMNHHPPVELDSGYHQYQQPQQEQMQPQHSPQPQPQHQPLQQQQQQQ